MLRWRLVPQLEEIPQEKQVLARLRPVKRMGRFAKNFSLLFSDTRTMQFEVIPREAHLRSAPRVDKKTELALLKQGQLVTSQVAAASNGWWPVTANVQGTHINGFMHQSVLRQLAAPAAPGGPPALVLPVFPNIPEAHLPITTAVRLNQTTTRSYSLNDPAAPRRVASPAATMVTQLASIIQYLKVETSLRYKKEPKKTFCNIYAHDYTHLASAYLPRVWWMPKALMLLAQGQPVLAQYGHTVSEMNVNSLYNWFEEFGDDFGWRRIFDLDAMQQAVNTGQVGIICGQHTNAKFSGHITAVVPETATNKAARKSGVVTIPLQSQAGAANRQYFSTAWWLGKQFGRFGFWLHA